MAKESEKRKNWFDDEEEDDLSSSKPSSTPGTTTRADRVNDPRAGQSAANNGVVDEATLSDLRALMEQTHQLYLMYFQGVERRPPMEKFNLLEKKFADVQRTMGQAGSAFKFRIQQMQQQFSVYKELWARKSKEKERT